MVRADHARPVRYALTRSKQLGLGLTQICEALSLCHIQTVLHADAARYGREPRGIYLQVRKRRRVIVQQFLLFIIRPGHAH